MLEHLWQVEAPHTYWGTTGGRNHGIDRFQLFSVQKLAKT